VTLNQGATKAGNPALKSLAREYIVN